MKVYYLGHSGFAVESTENIYVFDYIQGDLPNGFFTSGKSINIFVSHFHQDHFWPEIFNIFGNAKFILSNDTIKKIKRTKSIKDVLQSKTIYKALPYNTIEFGDFKVEMLKSTDEGVAYIVTENKGVIYHAGDLNWWDWPGEDEQWNRQMELDFKKEIDSIEGRNIDIAFVPLDPRQVQSYALGMEYITSKVNIGKVYPMHFWEKPRVIDRYIREHQDVKNIVSSSWYMNGE